MFSRLNQKHNLLTDLLFFLLFLVLPFQFGKHFWPFFAYVSGIRVDYLSPTIYLSDVLVVLLIMVTGVKKRLTFSKKFLTIFLTTILYLAITIFFSQSPMNGWYDLVKLIEYVLFGWIIAASCKNVTPLLFITFFIDVFLESTLAILQIVHQGALQGFWYFLGERAFSAATPGIANASINGQLVLRPYATFSHPNVFAGYLVVALLFFLVFLFTTKKIWQRILTGVVLLFGMSILLLTLSRVAIGVFFFLAVVYSFSKIKKVLPRLFLFGGMLLFALLTGGRLLIGRFTDVQGYVTSFFLRDILMQVAWQMFALHPLFGIGLGNFLVLLPHFLPKTILFSFLQPVHNIFLFVLAETGIVGLLLFVLLCFFALRQSWKQRQNPLSLFSFLSLVAILLIGMTDHYFLTLQQGQLLLTLLLGISMASLHS